MGGTKGPPAGPSAAAAFDVITALASATSRYDLSAGYGAPYQWPKANRDSMTAARSRVGGGSTSGSANGSSNGSPLGTRGTARLTSQELGRCIGLVFPGADRDGIEDSGS